MAGTWAGREFHKWAADDKMNLSCQKILNIVIDIRVRQYPISSKIFVSVYFPTDRNKTEKYMYIVDPLLTHAMSFLLSCLPGQEENSTSGL